MQLSVIAHVSPRLQYKKAAGHEGLSLDHAASSCEWSLAEFKATAPLNFIGGRLFRLPPISRRPENILVREKKRPDARPTTTT
jgi:hypothetical protein